MRYEYSQPNNCIYFEHGCCTRRALMSKSCPGNICWNDDGSNNTLCDFAGYQTKKDEGNEKEYYRQQRMDGDSE